MPPPPLSSDLLYPPAFAPMQDKDTGLITREWLAFFEQIAGGLSGAAPADAEYVLGAVNAMLANGRIPTDTATVTWDLSVAGQIKANASSGAPTDAEYIVAALHAQLSAERLATNVAGAGGTTWDFTTPGVARVTTVANVTGPAAAVDGEIALYDGATGKIIKRATGTGFVKAASGVYSTQASINLAADVGASILPLANGGTATALVAPGVDRMFFWDHSALLTAFLEANLGLEIVGTQLNVTNEIQDIGYYSPLTNGDPDAPELIFADGDVIMIWTDL